MNYAICHIYFAYLNVAGEESPRCTGAPAVPIVAAMIK